jgi:hypothetical protein
MEAIMKQVHITSAGGCLAALLVTGCGGLSPTSTASPLGIAAPQRAMGVPGIAGSRINRAHCHQFRVYPTDPSIKVNQQLKLSNLVSLGDAYGGCDTYDEDASWRSSSGSTIQPLHRGMKALFSAVRPGVYRVRADWDGRHGRDTVTVTLP